MKKAPLPVQNVFGSEKQQLCGKEALVKLLRWHFGHSEFRGKQLEAIEAAISGRDCFCLMPTGGGKSICFQIPALSKKGIVLVVCPLIGPDTHCYCCLPNLTISLDGKPSDGFEGERDCC